MKFNDKILIFRKLHKSFKPLNRKQTPFFLFCRRCKQIIEHAENPLFGY